MNNFFFSYNSGFSKTNICACIGPSLKNFEETYSTVLFASRAMTIRIDPKLNEEIFIKVIFLKENAQFKKLD